MRATNKSTRLNRRDLLAGAAAVAAPAPALAVPDDPIFAAIAARRATKAALDDSPEDGDVPHDLVAADDDAIRAMLQTPPTTMRGIKALLRSIVEWEEYGEFLNLSMEDDAGEPTSTGVVLARSLLTALERIA
jgi:hypothetical protein